MTPSTSRQTRLPSLVVIWQALFSWGTMISAALAVVVWSLEWSWATGIVFVALLYVHECGHVLAAQWRGLKVRRPPFFVLGLGAFVLIEPGPRVIDDALVFLAGPLIGGAAALAVKSAALHWHDFPLAFVAQVALVVNAINLAPFSPLDGGRALGRSGWIGFVFAVGLAAALVIVFRSLLSLSPVFQIIPLLGVYLAYRLARQGTQVSRKSQYILAVTYAAALVALLLALAWSGSVPPIRWHRTAWLPSLSSFEAVFYFYLAGLVALPYAWKPTRGWKARYLVVGLLGWPQYLLTRPAMAVISTLLALDVLGAPGLRWLGRVVPWLGDRDPLMAGAAVAYGYDLIRRRAKGGADNQIAASRLKDRTPDVERGIPDVLANALALMERLGYGAEGRQWAKPLADQFALRSDLSAMAANNLAWLYYNSGQPELGLPLARRAVGLELRPALLDTLGRLLIALERHEEAETALRQSLSLADRPPTRAMLARAVAAQGRLSEARSEVECALSDDRRRQWTTGTPTLQEAAAWLAQWQEQLGDPPEPLVDAGRSDRTTSTQSNAPSLPSRHNRLP